MPEQKKTSGKAVGVTGGGGVGLFLIKLASFITDPTWKDLYCFNTDGVNSFKRSFYFCMDDLCC